MPKANPIEHAREGQEQGVTSASLRLTLPAAHCVRSREDSRAEVRSHCVSARLSPSELALLQANASARHKKLGELLRESYFDPSRPVAPLMNAEKWKTLGEALGDLHLVTLRLNAGQLPEDLRPVLGNLLEQLHAMRTEILGPVKEKGD